MPKLSEYLGSIVSSITDARVMSDIQSVKVAEQYAKHSLLQHYAVPRMRVEDIELTIPVAVDTFRERTETIYEPLDPKEFNAAAFKEISKAIKTGRLTADISSVINTVIAEKTEELEKDIQLSKDIEPLNTYSQAVVKILPERHEKLAAYIKETSSDPSFEKSLMEINARLAPLLRIKAEKKVMDILDVTIESDKLREKKPDSLIYIKMKIVEEGMEWHKLENTRGEVEKKLLPE